MFKYYIYKFGQFLVNRLPSKVAYKLAERVSDIQYYCSFRDRRAVKNNLKLILKPGEDVSKAAKEVFRNFGRYLVDFFTMEKQLKTKAITSQVKLKNWENIQAALQKGKGGIVITAHLGNWELGAVALCQKGYPLVVVALPHKERPVNDLFNRQRALGGVTIVPTHIAMRKCLETLKENKLVALAADRDFSLNGMAIDFFGKKTLIPKGAAIFSKKTGAPIIPVFLIRDGNENFTLTIEKPIFPDSVNSSDIVNEDDLLPIIKQYAFVIEEKIRQYPTQWLMFREFWIK